jgi:hypothetical protein
MWPVSFWPLPVSAGSCRSPRSIRMAALSHKDPSTNRPFKGDPGLVPEADSSGFRLPASPSSRSSKKRNVPLWNV